MEIWLRFSLFFSVFSLLLFEIFPIRLDGKVFEHSTKSIIITNNKIECMNLNLCYKSIDAQESIDFRVFIVNS